MLSGPKKATPTIALRCRLSLYLIQSIALLVQHMQVAAVSMWSVTKDIS